MTTTTGVEITEHFARWFHEATEAEPRVPEAMQLITVTAEGLPSARTVLLKGFSPEGFVFYTNTRSRKGRDLLVSGAPRVVGLFHWKTLERQVILEGTAHRVDDTVADAYFATRSRGSQIGAWASEQSEPLTSREHLVSKVEEIEQRFSGTDVPRPPHWTGFQIRHDRIEFWQGMPDRLHHRTCFTRSAHGWSSTLLQP